MVKLRVKKVKRLIIRDGGSMLQVFYMDVVKIDRDIAHIIIVIHVCCKRPFHLLF